MNNVQANEIKIGMKLSGALAIQAMSTFKIRNIEEPNFTFWFNEEGTLIGHGTGVAAAPIKRERDITYFMNHTFEVIETIKPAFEHGDLVEITSNNADAELSKGEIVTFDKYRDGFYPVRVVKENGVGAIIFENDMRKLTDEEVRAHEKAVHKRKVNALVKGDIVKIKNGDAFGSKYKTGDLVVVVRQDPHDSEVPVRVAPLDKGEGYVDSEWARFYEIEIPTKEEIEEAKAIVKVTKVEAGTLIRITGRDATKPKYGDHALSNGKVVKVSRKRAGSKDAIRGFVDDVNGMGTFEYTVHGGDFEIMTSDEINAHEAKKLNLSKGEYLVVTKKGAGEIEAGTVVVSSGNQYSGGVVVNDLEGKELGFKYAYNLRRAEASEVAKAKEDIKEKKARKVFEKLGRQYGEFKQGDIVRVTDPLGGDFKVGDMSEVENTSTINFRCVLKATHQTQTGRYAEVELITPVEQRLDK
ncbi:hypothetical protein [Bacillus thuringiensis]|uniref:hypothetical protein n=1 Tax=Bacillus thuringiensis TaxID=1428 RepID=UPI000BEB797F|nr:hypothetical protein [Bacillus thuringiensis]PEE69392.1 hypothetical protein COM73_19090 [Bacillus thuringiensis]